MVMRRREEGGTEGKKREWRFEEEKCRNSYLPLRFYYLYIERELGRYPQQRLGCLDCSLDE